MQEQGDKETKSFFQNWAKRLSLRRLRNISLPDGILSQVLKQYIAAALLTVFSAGMCIVNHDPKYLYGLLFAGAFAALAVSNTFDYDDGKILEMPMQCVSSTLSVGRKAVRVVFCTMEDSPKYYEVYVPGKKETDFIPEATYVVYFNPDKPKELLGSTQL